MSNLTFGGGGSGGGGAVNIGGGSVFLDQAGSIADINAMLSGQASAGGSGSGTTASGFTTVQAQNLGPIIDLNSLGGRYDSLMYSDMGVIDNTLTRLNQWINSGSLSGSLQTEYTNARDALQTTKDNLNTAKQTYDDTITQLGVELGRQPSAAEAALLGNWFHNNKTASVTDALGAANGFIAQRNQHKTTALEHFQSTVGRPATDAEKQALDQWYMNNPTATAGEALTAAQGYISGLPTVPTANVPTPDDTTSPADTTSPGVTTTQDGTINIGGDSDIGMPPLPPPPVGGYPDVGGSNDDGILDVIGDTAGDVIGAIGGGLSSAFNWAFNGDGKGKDGISDSVLGLLGTAGAIGASIYGADTAADAAADAAGTQSDATQAAMDAQIEAAKVAAAAQMASIAAMIQAQKEGTDAAIAFAEQNQQNAIDAQTQYIDSAQTYYTTALAEAQKGLTGASTTFQQEKVDQLKTVLDNIQEAKTNSLASINNYTQASLDASNLGTDNAVAALQAAKANVSNELDTARDQITAVNTMSLNNALEVQRVGQAKAVSRREQGLQGALQAQRESLAIGVNRQERALAEAKGVLSPYAQAGTEALDAQRALSGARGPEAQQAAIDMIENSPQFQTLMKKSEEAILQNAAATGGVRGGRTQQALMETRPSILSGLIDKQYERLGGLSSMGQASSSQIAGIESSMGSQIGQAQIQGGLADAGLQTGAAQDVAGLSMQGGLAQAGMYQDFANRQSGALQGLSQTKAGLLAGLSQSEADAQQQRGALQAGVLSNTGTQAANIYGQAGSQMAGAIMGSNIPETTLGLNVSNAQMGLSGGQYIGNLLSQAGMQQANIYSGSQIPNMMMNQTASQVGLLGQQGNVLSNQAANIGSALASGYNNIGAYNAANTLAQGQAWQSGLSNIANTIGTGLGYYFGQK